MALAELALHLFRPVAKVCLKHSITLQDAIEALKFAFVEAATKENSSISASQINAMTGVHRLDIARIQASPKPAPPLNIVAKVLQYWSSNPNYLTKEGHPKVLGVKGKNSEFSKMVSEVSSAISSYTVLGELKRKNLISETPGGIKLTSSVYRVSSEDFEVFRYLETDIDDLFTVVEENIARPNNPPHHHITTEFDNISPEDIPKIDSWLFNQGAQFHTKLKKFLRCFDRDSDTGQSRMRVAFTSFSRINEVKK